LSIQEASKRIEAAEKSLMSASKIASEDTTALNNTLRIHVTNTLKDARAMIASDMIGIDSKINRLSSEETSLRVGNDTALEIRIQALNEMQTKIDSEVQILSNSVVVNDARAIKDLGNVDLKLQGNIDKLSEALTKEVGILKKADEELIAKDAGLGSDLKTMKADMDKALQATEKSVNENLANIRTAIEQKMSAENAQHEIRFQNMDKETSHLQKQVNDTSYELSNVGKQSSALEAQMTIITSTVAKQEESIGSAQKDYRDELTTLRKDLAEKDAQNAELRSKLDVYAGLVDTVMKKVEGFGSTASTLAALESKLSTMQSDHQKEIAALAQRLTVMEQEKSGHITKLSTCETSLNAVEKRIGALETELATGRKEWASVKSVSDLRAVVDGIQGSVLSQNTKALDALTTSMTSLATAKS
jgi:predicted  nucleic acid-binding Zn-ribbon protein